MSFAIAAERDSVGLAGLASPVLRDPGDVELARTGPPQSPASHGTGRIAFFQRIGLRRLGMATAIVIALTAAADRAWSAETPEAPQAPEAAASASAASGAEAPPAADCPPLAALPSPSRMQALVRDARDHGFLWQLTKDGHASWLYGTIHAARVEWDVPGPALQAAIVASDTLALELDPSDPTVQHGITEAIGAVQRPAMPAQLALRLDRAARAECLPPAPFDALPPEVRIMILETLVGRRDGIDPSYGIDVALAGIGRARKMNLVSLETPALQMQALQTSTEKASLDFIARSLDEIERGTARSQLAKLAQAWADGDFAMLESYPTWCDCLASEVERAQMKRVLDDRNPGLADAIDALHRSGDRVFAAVGSAHMIGPSGLPALLIERGYRVERVDFHP